MDVLSDAVTAALAGRPHAGRVVRKAPFADSVPAGEGAAFHVVLQGSCLLLPPDGEPVPLTVGDVAFLPRAAAHGLAAPASAPPGGTTVLLSGGCPMDVDRAHPLLAELPDLLHLPAKVGRDPALHTAVDLLGQELDAPGPGGDAALPALLDLLLLYLLRDWLAGRPGGWAAALRDPAVAAALRAVHADPARPWSVEELGRRGGLSRAAFARRFAALVGRPPLAYLTWWRLTTAARLLRDTDAPLTAIAAQVGYGSEPA
ncbi:AraC family transcriptional regulator, partial [Nonomuraea sp. MCN248]